MLAYHKTPQRAFLNVSAALLDAKARAFPRGVDLPTRWPLARELWASDVHEACIFAAKLLTKARIRPDDSEVWSIISRGAQGIDSWALADHAATVGAKRLQAEPSRVDNLAH